MNIAIIGSGYVGLTTGSCLADLGHKVICVDNNVEKVEMLKNGQSPIYEPKLTDIIQKNLGQNLNFTTDIRSAVQSSEVIFICVNTPPKKDGQADLRYIEKVAREISQHLEGYKVIVDKSTVPVKTAEKVKETILRYCPPQCHFDVVSNPEFLREGSAVDDTFHPDRIVIGVDSKASQEKMLEVYKPLIENSTTNPTVMCVSVRSAELIKHGANTFLATKISFANMIAQACENAGADAIEVLKAIGLDKRIGNQFLQPGIGFGGSCFPKDIAAFKKTLEILGVDTDMIQAVEKINEDAWKKFVQKIEKELWVLDGKVIGILGLAFKANTDDIRNAPALKIIRHLLQDGAKIKVYDPQAMKNCKNESLDIEYCDDPYSAAQNCEALIICTDWDEFKNLDIARLKETMTTPIIFDGRNILNPQHMKEAGFKYFGVGR